MALNTNELVNKINLVRASRYLMRNSAVTEHFPLSNEATEISEILHQMIFAYIKNKFPGCRIRPGETNFSIRMDAEVHQKARKLREVILQNVEWKRWFEENHRHITDTIVQNANSFHDTNYVEYSITEDKHFMRIPFVTNRIRNFSSEGLMRLFSWLDGEYSKDSRLAALYQQTVTLMENEIRAREERRTQRIERERTQYLQGLRDRLIKSITPPTTVDRSSINAEVKFKVKMYDWCRENGLNPAYAEEITPQIMLPKDTGVRIIAREGQREMDWYAVPMFGGYTMPEGFALKDRWGKVSDFNNTDKRSRNGQAPIVLDGFVFTSFNVDHWAHTIPAEYEQYIAASRRIRPEAEAEAAEATRIYEEQRAEREAEAKRLQDEQMEARRAELRERLTRQREQASQEPISTIPEPAVVTTNPFAAIPSSEDLEDEGEEYGDDEEGENDEIDEPVVEERTPAMDALSASIRAQVNRRSDNLLQQLQTLQHNPGVYMNGKGLPIEKYTVVRENGAKHFFRTNEEASQFARSVLSANRLEYVYDYWRPTVAVEHIHSRR